MTNDSNVTGTEAERAPADGWEEFLVVRNDEEQYSIWRADRDLPAGWYAGGRRGTRQECLDHIEEVWTDMRPLSLRRRLAGADA